jgi:hypothetical protein
LGCLFKKEEKEMKKEFRSFNESCIIVRELHFRIFKDWEEYCKSGNKPDDIPTNPEIIYKKEWRGWGYWLGTEYLPFDEAREYACNLSLSGFTTWSPYCKSGNKPNYIPSNPHVVYKKEWRGWEYWLDSLDKPNRFDRYLSYDDAKKIVHTLNFTGQKQWLEYCRTGQKPQNIPASPKDVYRKKYKGFPDWLNSKENRTKKYRNFKDAKKFVHTLNFTGQKEWWAYCKSGQRPKNIPSNPQVTYKKEWKGVGDWLGTGKIALKNRKYLSFSDAKKIVHTLNLKGVEEWKIFRKTSEKPSNIPSTPDVVYKKEWNGYGDWLGTGKIANQTISKRFLPFNEAREIARKLAKKYNLKNTIDWQKAVIEGKIPKNIPNFPSQTYSKKYLLKKSKIKN